MAFSINTNTGALKTNLFANTNSKSLNATLGALSSGSKLANAAYNASSLGIANQLSAQLAGLGVAIQNSNESIGMIQIADGALSGINDNMQRIQTLTLQASNGTLSAEDRAIIQKEIDGLLKSSDNIAKSTSYNGIKLLDGTGGSNANGSFSTQSGANSGESTTFSIANSTVASLVGTIDVTTENGRNAALDSLSSAQQNISSTRADLGSAQNQLMSNINNISVSQVNIASAESNMRDVDFAQESANFSKQNILAQTGVFAQAQANNSRANLAGLLG